MSTAVRDAILIYADGQGFQGQLRVHYNRECELADMEASIRDLAFALSVLTDCQLIDGQICYSIQSLAPYPDNPGAQSDVEKGGQLTFHAVSTALARITIPGLVDSVVIAGTKRINQANSDVQALVYEMLRHNYTAWPVASDNSPLDALQSATQHFTKTRTSRNA